MINCARTAVSQSQRHLVTLGFSRLNRNAVGDRHARDPWKQPSGAGRSNTTVRDASAPFWR